MLKAVIFDMDGVIIDSEPAHVRFEEELFKELGIHVSSEEHNSFIGTTSHYMWEKLKVKHNLSHTLEELVKNDRNKYYKFLLSGNHDIALIEGVRELIRELDLKGVRMAIASSSPLNVIQTVVKMYKIEEYFEALVTGDYVKKSKPEPDVFLYAAEKLEVKPEECIVIEDSANGAAAAKRAGMKCVGFKNPNSGNQNLSPADIIITSYKEISAEGLCSL